jgi:hypothetical protein
VNEVLSTDDKEWQSSFTLIRQTTDMVLRIVGLQMERVRNIDTAVEVRGAFKL